MNLKQALATAIGQDKFDAVKDHLLGPELLRMAALRAFVNGTNDEATLIIRMSLLKLEVLGQMQDMNEPIIIPKR